MVTSPLDASAKEWRERAEVHDGMFTGWTTSESEKVEIKVRHSLISSEWRQFLYTLIKYECVLYAKLLVDKPRNRTFPRKLR